MSKYRGSQASQNMTYVQLFITLGCCFAFVMWLFIWLIIPTNDVSSSYNPSCKEAVEVLDKLVNKDQGYRRYRAGN